MIKGGHGFGGPVVESYEQRQMMREWTASLLSDIMQLRHYILLVRFL